SSTALTTRKCWWCGFTRSSWPSSICLEAGHEEHLGRALRGYPQPGELSHSQRDRYPQVFPQRLQSNTARALSQSTGRAEEDLAILRCRRPGAEVLEGLEGRI